MAHNNNNRGRQTGGHKRSHHDTLEPLLEKEIRISMNGGREGECRSQHPRMP